jgi:hypothetical protein
MIAMGLLFVRMLCDYFKPRQQLESEILVLRHQLNVLQQRAPRRPHLRWVDRALFIWLYRRCPRILNAITIVRPETVLRWHRMGFAAYWRWKSRSAGGRAPWPRMAPSAPHWFAAGSYLNAPSRLSVSSQSLWCQNVLETQGVRPTFQTAFFKA